MYSDTHGMQTPSPCVWQGRSKGNNGKSTAFPSPRREASYMTPQPPMDQGGPRYWKPSGHDPCSRVLCAHNAAISALGRSAGDSPFEGRLHGLGCA
jgi:hypothetical protein